MGHSISDDIRERLYADMQRFFALPLEEKQKLHSLRNKHNRGWTAVGEEKLDPLRQTCGDTKEGYYIGREIPPGHPLESLPLHGPNVWPDLPEWRENMMEYAGVMERIGDTLNTRPTHIST